jgi:hypothetical protein
MAFELELGNAVFEVPRHRRFVDLVVSREIGRQRRPHAFEHFLRGFFCFVLAVFLHWNLRGR